MPYRLHITNGDSVEGGIRAADPDSEIVPWRDVLHEGPVPPGLSLPELSRVRAAFLTSEGMGTAAVLERELMERDDALRRFADHDEVVLWFEWDLYDQLQLIQLLDFFAAWSADSLAETNTVLSIICIRGYLGTIPSEEFPKLHAGRTGVTRAMLDLGARAFRAFRSGDPRQMEDLIRDDTSALEFLAHSFARLLEELPSTFNGLARSEQQILEAVAQKPLSFSQLFRRTGNREERIYCGDATMARYIQRMSRHPHPLLLHPTGETIAAPRHSEDSSAFRNSEIALTETGREVLSGNRDWIDLGGTDRWIGGIHLDRGAASWRWDVDSRSVVTRKTSQ